MGAVPVTTFKLNGSPVAAGASDSEFIGTTAALNISFSNASPTTPGYVPFIDLTLPANSASGLTFASATYLGSAVVEQSVTFDANGHATHPFLKGANGNAVVVQGPPGGTLLVLSLPFGSFTPGQTPADIQVNLNISSNAVLGAPLDVTATPGFAFGDSPTGVSASNPPIIGTQTDLNVVPQLVKLSTVYVGPEQETATGPSYPRDWDSVATIAPGQTLTNLVLTQKLPDGAVFLPGSSALLYGAGAAAGDITYDAATNTVTGTFTEAVTGGAAGTLPTLQAAFYVTSNYTNPANGTTVLDPTTGSFAPLTDTSNLTATWHSSNPLNPTSITAAPVSDTITAKSIAIQKSVIDLTHGANATQAGDTLQYSLNGQVSNYFDLTNLVITDTLGDGQTFKAGFTPTITIADLGQTLYSGSVAASEFSVSGKAADGTSIVTFNVSKILIDHGKPADLDGGTAANPHQATASVTFDTTIDTNYSSHTPPSVSTLVDQGDPIGNTVVFSGDVVGSGDRISDNSSAGITLPTNAVAKTVYAVNGKLVTPGQKVVIQAGDLVTYDLRMTTPLTSTQHVTLTDFLPLPTFTATDPNAQGTTGGFTFVDAQTSTAPAVGVAEFGPADTFHTADPSDVPTVTTNGTANSLTFDFGDYTLSPNYPSNIADVLYTVRAGDEAFADGLLLTNQVTESETNSFGAITKQNAIVQVNLGQPELKIEKAVVATNEANARFTGSRGPDTYSAPGSAGTRFSGGVISGAALASTPVGADSVSGIVAGDSVTFAVVVENTGSGPNGAFDVVLHDTLPTGFDPATNIRVTDGAGNLLAYTNVGGGLFDPNGGIKLTDHGAQGSLTAYDATSGKNVVVITYDATAAANVPVPNYDLHNVATITEYTAMQGGINHVSFTPAANLTAASDVYTAKPTFAKAVIATSDAAPTPGANNIHNLAIGSIATYDITLTLTKGTAGQVTIRDVLPNGAGGELDLVSAFVKSIGADLTGSMLAVGATSNISGGGFDFGDISDFSNAQGSADQIVVEVQARAVNVAANQGGRTLTNTAILTETDPNNPQGSQYTQTATASELLVEPELKLVKTVSAATAQANDVVTYTLALTNGNDGHSAAAYDDVITDTLAMLAPNAVFQAGTVRIAAGTTATGATIVQGNSAGDTAVGVNVGEIDPGQAVYVTFQAKLTPTALDDATIRNTATVTGDTLTGHNPNGRVDTTTGSASLLVQPATVQKTLIAGSDPNIAVPKLAAGETGTYKLVISLPHGQTANLSVADAIPSTMQYVAGSAQLISEGANITGGTGLITTVTSGNPTFSFGTVQDNGSGPDTAADQIVVQYKALVLPVAANGTSGTTDVNTARVLTGSTVLGSSSATANIVAPKLTLTKTANLNGALPEAGSDVTYTLVIGQIGSSPAYNLNLSDLLPSDETYDVGSATANNGAQVSFAGGVLTVTDNQLLVGAAPVTVTYSAHLNNTVTPGEQLANTASVTTTTQPTGGYTEPAVTATAIVAIDLKPTEVKTVLGLSNNFSPSNVITGETITYKLLTTLQNGTQHFRLQDALPSGLGFVSATVASVGSGITGIATGPITPMAGTTNFDFGTVVAAPGIGTADQVEIDVVATVTNSSGPDAFTNTAIALTSAPGSTTIGLETSTSSAPTLTQVYSSLSGTVFTDYNDDGQIGGADAGLGGVTVQLLDGNGNPTGATTTTAANGTYIFTGLNVGTYGVQVVKPVGDGFSPKGTNANPALDSIVDPANGRTVPVTLLPGANTPNQNAGVYVPVSLSGNVFADMNADGVKEAGDASLATITVNLIGADGHSIIRSTTTDASGNYAFTGLPPGTYNVAVAKPAGQTFSPVGASATLPDSIVNASGATAPVTLTSGQSAVNQNAGIYGPGSLSGRVFVDQNDDGVIENGDNGLGGVTVKLLNSSGVATGATTTTAADGTYSFAGLNPGSYEVQVVAPGSDGFSPVGANANPALDSIVGGTGKTAAVAVLSNTNTPNQNAGLYVPASISGTVFNDANADGAKAPGDAGLGGQTVNLIGADGHTIVATATTVADGTYSFTGLKPASYSVAVVKPAGETFSPVGTSPTLPDSIVDAGGSTPTITLVSGQSVTNQNAGVYGPGSLSGKVFIDQNDDGVIETGDNGLGGVTVKLLNSSGVATGATTTTAADGTYSFAGLTPGGYEVQVVAPGSDGFSPVGTNANAALDSIVSLAGKTAAVAVLSNTNTPNQNAGLYVPASLTGNVFNDSNDDGVRNGADNAHAGVAVQLLDASGNPIAGATATTDASGNYAFTGLKPGTYSVAVTAPAGNLFSPVGANPNTALDSAVNTLGRTTPVTLASGQVSANNNAGLFAPGSLSGTVFLDQNDDGVKQAGDTPVAGAAVQLLDSAGAPVAGKTTTTDALGNYSFGGLVPGSYAVAITAPAGDGFSPVGTSASLPDSIVNPLGRTAPVAVLNATNTPNQNAGVYAPVSLTGTVFNDNNDDGVRNGTDNAHAGVTVKLLDAGGNPTGATTTTDANGNYAFTGLKPGTYAVAFTPVAGSVFSPVGANANKALDSEVNSIGRTAPVTLTSGQTSANNNAGLFPPGSLSGTIFLDKNGDGVKETGDTPVAGVTVQLLDGTGAAIAGRATTTDALGNYSFGGLVPGSYAVAVTAPSGDAFSPVGTSATLPDSIVNAGGRTAPTAVTNGHDTPNQNAGVYVPATLTGNVFNDTNADGAHEPTEGVIPQVQVQLLNAAGQPIAGRVALTDAQGNYSFAGLAPGSYSVRITPPANDVISPKGTNLAYPDSTLGANGVTPVVTLASGQTANQISGLYLPTPKLSETKSANTTLTDGGHVVTYTVVLAHAAGSTGNAYNVTLSDLLAPGETLIAGSATATAGTVTSTGGKVAFTDPSLALGAAPVTITYQARTAGDVVNGQRIVNTANLAYASLPTGGVGFTGSSSATIGIQLLDSISKSFVVTPLAQTSSVAAGDTVTFDVTASLDTGAQALTLSDLLPNGLTYVSSKLDSLGGVTGSSLAVGSSGTFNAATSTVSFNLGNIDTPIGAASNQVTFEVTATVAAGTAIGSVLTNVGKLVSTTPTNSYGVAAGTPGQTLTAAAPITVVAAATIKGNAFLDAHCDGTNDYGDPAFKGITVKLYDGSGDFTGVTTTTDSNGNYSFGNLAPGQYEVRYVLPNGTKFTDGEPGAGSNVTASTGFGPVITLAAGQTNASQNVGLALTGGYANSPTTYLNATTTFAAGNGSGITIVGGSGPQTDSIDGGIGNNILIGGEGINYIEGGTGTNLILGGCGDYAQIQSLGTNDFVFGSKGDDLIQAHAGNAFIAAGPGNQTIAGGGGTNTFIANANRGTISYTNGSFSNIAVGDTFITAGHTNSVYEKGDGVLYIEDYDASQGDTLSVFGYSAPVATAQVGAYEVLYFGQNAAVLLRATAATVGNPNLGVTYSASLPTTAPLTISIDANNYLTLSVAGQATPAIGAPANPPLSSTVTLSQSNPSYTGGDAATTVTGQGYNTVKLGDANNTVSLGGYSNSVTVGNGSNNIAAGLGNSTVNAGNGNNVIKAAGYSNVANVGTGNDTIDIGAYASIHAAGGNQAITLSGYSNMVFIGGTGASVISGGLGNSQITQTGGSAQIALGGMSNVVTTGAASDTIADGTGYTKFVIGSTQAGQANGHEVIGNFASTSIVDLVPLAAAGHTAAQLYASIYANAAGNAELDFAAGGSLIFQGLSPTQLHAANFQVG